MPNCIIKDCKYYSGRKLNESDDVTLHVFPKNLETIKKWLQSIQKSGQDFGDIDEFAQRVYDGKKSDLFRICSQHFEENCYTFQVIRKKFMKKEAVPTIFKKEQKKKPKPPPEPEPPVKKVRRDPSPIKELDPAEIESGVYPLYMYQSVIGEPHSAMLHTTPLCENHESNINTSGLYVEDSSPSTSHSSATVPKIVSCMLPQESTPDIVPQVAMGNMVPPTPIFHTFPSFADVGVNTENFIKKDASTDTLEFKDIANAKHTDSTYMREDKSVQVPET
ncbi:uncharacterized protein LOC134927533 [Pseudophryne corroboree]|uniref:uncharacterized protein LOC134927533 n=1 Tax=Pseudophryne corroboree TaxID=495146 RepID=UPI003081561E